MTSYYVNAVFDLPREAESRFTMNLNPDSLIEYPLNHTGESKRPSLRGCSQLQFTQFV